jgi:hypothetical protein
LPGRGLDPWISLGAGWETLHVALGATSTSSATYQGPIAGALKVGLDAALWGPARAFTVGPYFGMSVGDFTVRSLDPAPAGEGAIGAIAAHEWFTLGIRVTYGPLAP